ncbi:class I SAM-dependent methyltransferase [Oscillatoria sp. FACHB-1406]|uniref:class I SAM-dependent methyltransferase n=1 Tax=Oscillatoria sp. FACHB-1406 TaxID=2692846 RepID=UPI00168274A7|nr:class I SAM-dependent methyltransferase [Oscillatoria sp. FACHB-1406]MBD2577751.1 class I SAM-dependent methyltransferase [Oscillatoria sp. FACHB-1406]
MSAPEPVFRCSQYQHDLLPQGSVSAADLEFAREVKEFRVSLFKLFQTKIDAAIAESEPEIDPNRLYLQIRKVLDNCAEVQQAHEYRGILQDKMWASVSTQIQAERQRLESVYQSHWQGKGALELNSNLKLPLHQLKTNIHRMPGGYLDGNEAEPFEVGALYDAGTFLYGLGWFGPLNDELGHTLINQVIAPYYPDFSPQTILDLGCAVGHSTLPYTAAYPTAKVWGIDLGASLLRFAIARARILESEVYFAQQNAEKTDFDDRSFDLVVSHILLHEIPASARQRVFTESYRLLKPGGLMVHLESILFLQPPTWVARYFRDTEVWANSEPYLASSKFEDFGVYALKAGFSPDSFQIRYVPSNAAARAGQQQANWVAFCAVK